jgi:hypothetical protein
VPRLAGWLLCLELFAPGVQAAIRDGGIDPSNLGKGDWVYSIADATNKLGNHVSSVTNETSLMLFYKSQGIRYMIVKAGTGATLFNACYSFPQFTANLVNIAHANGILIFGYNRSYATNTAGESAIADFVFNQGADGFVWDAEAEWESGTIGTQGPTLAWAQCSMVRSNWPTKFLAHAPFPIIYLHSSFPYKEFGFWCDAVMPQIYHFSATKGSQSAAITWSDVNWKTWQSSLASLPPTNNNGVMVYWTNATKPLAPINDVYGPVGSSPCEGTTSPYPDQHVMEFIDYLTADPMPQTVGGYKGVNFWRADLHGPVQWSYIKMGTSGSFTGIVNGLVMDDPSAAKVGAWNSVLTWSFSTTAATFVGNGSGTDTNSFGTNYLTKGQGTGSAYVQFTPHVVVPGSYDVYQWHPFLTNASASVPFVITYNSGSTTVLANQQTNANNWSLLGRFGFLAGTSGNIRVTDGIAESSAVAMADGVKLVFVPPASVPTAPSGLNANPVSTSQISLAWTNTATNQTGFILSRSGSSGGPYTDIASLLGSTTNYTDSGLSQNTAYYYVVRATNFLGASALSTEAGTTTLGVPTAPAITAQTTNLTVIAGQDATLTVSATGSTPLSYQWWYNGNALSGSTNNAYTRSNAQPVVAGPYTVIVTNSLGAATSSPAMLAVNFSLATAVSGSGSVSTSPNQPSYIPNSTVTLTATPNSSFAFIGWSGDAGGTNNPLSLLLTTNESVTANFVSTATDLILDNTDPAVSFIGLWQTGTTSPDKYGPDYRFALTQAGGQSNAIYRPYIYNPGYYNVYVWYPQGSNRATNAPWSVFYSGGNATVAVNQTINGGQWVLLTANRPFLQGTNGYVLLSNNTGYSGSVVLADAVRFLFSSALPAPPTINSQPQSQAGVPGGTGSFSVSASGTAPLQYQWALNGTNLASQTSSTLTLTNLQQTDFGNYMVLVSNDGGSVPSTPAALTQAVQPLLVPVSFDSSAFTFSFLSELGPTYAVEFKTDLMDDPQWQPLTNFSGTGATLQAVDSGATNEQRFYRVHVQ